MNPENLASQLRRPSGRDASDVGRRMNEANRAVNHECIALLQITQADRVLEIGPGNGAFASDIASSAEGVCYTGLDWSAEMVAEAGRLNEELIRQGRARFREGSADRLPFPSDSFDKVLTVHTLYFWEHPDRNLAEIHRVLKPGGLFCMAFGDRAFMKDLPFVPYGFTLYDVARAETILRETGFGILNVQQHTEIGRSNTGEEVEKLINIVLCTSGEDAPDAFT